MLSAFSSTRKTMKESPSAFHCKEKGKKIAGIITKDYFCKHKQSLYGSNNKAHKYRPAFT